MAVSLYDAAIPVYLQFLRNLLGMLDKAEAEGGDMARFTQARLAPDMHPFFRQIQMASDAAKGGAARLAGVAPPSFPDVEVTFPELKERIAKTIAFVESVTREQVEGDDERIIELPLPSGSLKFTARDFVFRFSLGNFMFHVVTAYSLLRSQGVPLGKMDFLAGAVSV